ncbi:barstar family protein [Antrihabitans stalactiti]|uniref:Barstar family protein n=1 Tax=Antrihabitans stalactiti TaxID=2584121 RepID=A0A848KBC4_9NOCA|nr:barstar family protein [Antrihabitans stalactiti]NMN96173.1 barstar family protein [Antrihabitans stalactiti]
MRTVEKFLADRSSAVFGVVAATPGQASVLRYRLPELGYVVREVRGAKMPTVGAVFDEFAAAFQFPDYFGENKDAFDECMRDLEEFVGAAKGYVVVVRDAAQLLRDEPAERAWFADAMAFYASEWSNRADPVVFRVVLLDRSGSVPIDGERLALKA